MRWSNQGLCGSGSGHGVSRCDRDGGGDGEGCESVKECWDVHFDYC